MSISYQKKIANSIIQKSFAHNQFGYPSFTDYWHIICIKITPGADERAECVHQGRWGADSTTPQVHSNDPHSQRGPLPRTVCPQRTTDCSTGVTSGAQAISPRVSLRARGQEFELETESLPSVSKGSPPIWVWSTLLKVWGDKQGPPHRSDKVGILILTQSPSHPPRSGSTLPSHLLDQSLNPYPQIQLQKYSSPR